MNYSYDDSKNGLFFLFGWPAAQELGFRHKPASIIKTFIGHNIFRKTGVP